ncbi:MAG TPA: hypothetical protein IAB97_02020 [Candidatus Choladousia intestinipullorum]|nr:hypothetical protein [Candidatus Choladousia intestinipullorum]
MEELEKKNYGRSRKNEKHERTGKEKNHRKQEGKNSERAGIGNYGSRYGKPLWRIKAD